MAIHQLPREAFTDEQYATLCNIFSLSVRLKRIADERRKQGTPPQSASVQ